MVGGVKSVCTQSRGRGRDEGQIAGAELGEEDGRSFRLYGCRIQQKRLRQYGGTQWLLKA